MAVHTLIVSTKKPQTLRLVRFELDTEERCHVTDSPRGTTLGLLPPCRRKVDRRTRTGAGQLGAVQPRPIPLRLQMPLLRQALGEGKHQRAPLL